MKRLIITVVLLAGMLMAVQPASAITFGQLDGNEHPNVGAVVIQHEGRQYAICSGTLIAGKVFLTAAHCVEDGQELWVSFDSTFDQQSELISGMADAHDLFGSGAPTTRTTLR